jgi:hypothetical protein
MRARSLRFWVWAVALATPATVLAGSVFLNGVNIDGVTNQKFDHANVRIDERGNVLIDAPGYAVKTVQPGMQGGMVMTNPGMTGTGVPMVPQPQMTRRYWLVTEQTVPGMTEYDIDVYVNAKWIRKLRNSEEQIVTEVTKFLQPGRNTVLLTAHKVSNGPRKSFSPEHLFQVILGEGNVGGDNVMIDNPLVKFKVTAADTDDTSKEFSFNTR